MRPSSAVLGAAARVTRTVALAAGDGIGPEVMREAVKVLSQVERLSKSGAAFRFTEAFVGGAGFDKHGVHFGKEAVEVCGNSDAVLFGSVGGPVSERARVLFALVRA